MHSFGRRVIAYQRTMEASNPMFVEPCGVEFSLRTVSIDGELDSGGLVAKGSSSSVELKRTLTFTDGFAVVVGIMIGSGIFASPGLALQRAGSAGLVLIGECSLKPFSFSLYLSHKSRSTSMEPCGTACLYIHTLLCRACSDDPHSGRGL